VQNKWLVKIFGIIMVFIFATLVVLVWFATDIATQAGAFAISVLGLALAIAVAALPVKCQPCECRPDSDAGFP